jgi:hypothetical protein
MYQLDNKPKWDVIDFKNFDFKKIIFEKNDVEFLL